MNIARRTSSEVDYNYAKNVHDTAYREWIVAQFGPWQQEAQDKFFDDSWNRYKYEILLLDDEPCGYCAIEILDDEVRIWEFAVDIDFQGRGVGTHFLTELVSLSDKPVRMNAFKANSRAIRFYQHLGFETIGETELQLEFEWPNRSANKLKPTK